MNCRYEYVDGGKPIPKPPRKIVNKKLKVKYKKYIEEFYNYVCGMKSVLKFSQQYDPQSIDGAYGWKQSYEMKREVDADMGWYDEILREIIKNRSHKFQLNLVVNFLYNAQDITDRKKFRATYNRWINRELGFIKEKR